MRKTVNAAALTGLLVILFLIAGFFTGWNAQSFVPDYVRLMDGLSVHINNISEIKDHIGYFVRRCLVYSAPLAAMWSLAFVPPAAFLAPFFVFVKALGLGFVIRTAWDTGAALGLKQTAVLTLPQNLILVPVFCVMASNSICQALGALRARAIARDMGGGTVPRLRLAARGGKPGYAGKLASALIFAFIAAAWETWLTPQIYRLLIK